LSDSNAGPSHRRRPVSRKPRSCNLAIDAPAIRSVNRTATVLHLLLLLTFLDPRLALGRCLTRFPRPRRRGCAKRCHTAAQMIDGFIELQQRFLCSSCHTNPSFPRVGFLQDHDDENFMSPESRPAQQVEGGAMLPDPRSHRYRSGYFFAQEGKECPRLGNGCGTSGQSVKPDCHSLPRR
jgi:hypothetical protein